MQIINRLCPLEKNHYYGVSAHRLSNPARSVPLTWIDSKKTSASAIWWAKSVNWKVLIVGNGEPACATSGDDASERPGEESGSGEQQCRSFPVAVGCPMARILRRKSRRFPCFAYSIISRGTPVITLWSKHFIGFSEQRTHTPTLLPSNCLFREEWVE